LSTEAPFWEAKGLSEMTSQEWESICDGCAKCCLVQLQDTDRKKLVFTDVACDLLDDTTCRCGDYVNRSKRVPSCISMNAGNVESAAAFAPPSCAYRLLLEGRPLPDWHHLVSGSKSTVHETGNSVRHRVRFQREVEEFELESYVVEWPAHKG